VSASRIPCWCTAATARGSTVWRPAGPSAARSRRWHSVSNGVSERGRGSAATSRCSRSSLATWSRSPAMACSSASSSRRRSRASLSSTGAVRSAHIPSARRASPPYDGPSGRSRPAQPPSRGLTAANFRLFFVAWRARSRTMKTDLDHLPEAKRRELAYVVQVIRDGFAFAIARRTMPELRGGRLLKIILFGSYARGDWVEDPVGRYFSDYDLLVIVDREPLTDVPEFWSKTEERLLTDLAAGQELRTPVSLIYHSLDDVNDKLRLGRYFFIDIVRDGIVLFEEAGFPLA